MSKAFFARSEPFASGRLRVSDLHELYYEQVGNPDGIPIVYLHGGPGGYCDAAYRALFDPKIWNLILFDQRGCGRSTPLACIDHNTTWDLVSDIEKLRQWLNIDEWVVCGGSWGTTLALAYGQTYPQHCLAFWLRGVFLGRNEELQWLYQPNGAAEFYPDAWEEFIEPLPPEQRHDPVAGYFALLSTGSRADQEMLAKNWSRWETQLANLRTRTAHFRHFDDPNNSIPFAKIECHYFTNHCFFDHSDYILRRMDRIRDIPCWIIHGRYDMVCRPASSWALHQAWPKSRLSILPTSGHSVFDESMPQAMATTGYEISEYLIGNSSSFKLIS